MRLWSLHPALLDTKGLVACWRESLLAQKVLAGNTTGYINHPQLERFRAQAEPSVAVSCYLQGLLEESLHRGYHFDAKKICHPAPEPPIGAIPVSQGQITFERAHLLGKLQVRDPARATALEALPEVELHPLFYAVPGAVESWERDGA